MAETNERAGFSIDVDLDRFRQQMSEYERRLGRMERSSEQTSGSITSSFDKIKGAVGAALTGAALTGFVQKVIQARGEVRSLEIAFETMLGSSEKAQALMSQLTKTAAVTPFDMNSVAQGAKQLLAFGESSETVNDSLVRLGNIASGMKIPLNDIVYLYGTTMTQGRVFTQDIRQFLGRGIPIVKELAKNLNVTEQAVNEMVTAGKIGFEDVQKALWNMTNEGGMFFNLMQKESKELNGQLSNLDDAFSTMLSDIGQKIEPALAGGLSLVSSAIKNYETIGKVIANLVAIYGSYKAAMLVNIVIEKRAALARLAHIKVIKAQAAAQMALNALKNPYVAIGAAVAAVAVSVAIWTQNTNKQTYAQRRLNKELEEGRKKVDEEMTQIREYISVLQDERASIYAKIAALKELRKVQGFENLTMESAKNISDEEVAELERKMQEGAALATYEKRVQQYTKYVEETKKKIKEIENDPNLTQVTRKERLDHLTKNLAGYEKLLAEYTGDLRRQEAKLYAERKEADFERLSAAEKVNELERRTLAAKEKERAIEEQIARDGDPTGILKLQLEASRKLRSEDEKRLTTLKVTTNEIKNYDYWEKKRKEATDAFHKSLPGTAEHEEAKRNIRQAEEAMKAWELQTQKQADSLEELRERLRRVKAENEAFLNSQGKGEFEQRRIEAEHEYKEALINAEKERDSALKQAGEDKALQEAIASNFAQTLIVIKKQYDNAIKAIADEEKKALEEVGNQIADYWKEEFEREIADIAREGKEQIEELERRFGKDSDAFRQKSKEIAENTRARQEDARVQNEIKNSQLRLETDKEQLKTLESINGKRETALALLEREQEAILEQIEALESQEYALSPDELAQLERLRDELKKNNVAIAETKKELRSVYLEYARLFDELGSAMSGSSSNLVSGFGQIFGALSRNFEQLKAVQSGTIDKMELGMSAFTSSAKFALDVFETMKRSADENEQAQKLWQSQIRAAAHELSMLRIEAMEFTPRNIFGTDDPFDKIASAMEQASASEAELLNKLMKINSEGFVKVGTRQVVDGKGVGQLAGSGAMVGGAIGSFFSPVGTAVGSAIGAVVGAIAGLFTSKKTVDVFDKLSERYGSVYDAETLEINPEILADYDKLNEETKELIDHYKELKDVHAEAMEQMEEQILSLTGEIGNELSNSLVEAFTGGDTYAAVDDFRDYVYQRMQDIVQAQIFSKVFGNLFDNLEAELKDVAATNPDAFLRKIAGTTAEVERLIPVYNKLTSDLKEVWARQGVSLFEEAKGLENVQDALQGTIASMSESTADELNANFLGLKLTAMEISSAVSVMKDKQSEYQAIQQASMNALLRIESNTAFCRELSDIKADIRAMRNEGIEIK